MYQHESFINDLVPDKQGAIMEAKALGLKEHEHRQPKQDLPPCTGCQLTWPWISQCRNGSLKHSKQMIPFPLHKPCILFPDTNSHWNMSLFYSMKIKILFPGGWNHGRVTESRDSYEMPRLEGRWRAGETLESGQQPLQPNKNWRTQTCIAGIDSVSLLAPMKALWLELMLFGFWAQEIVSQGLSSSVTQATNTRAAKWTLLTPCTSCLGRMSLKVGL